MASYLISSTEVISKNYLAKLSYRSYLERLKIYDEIENYLSELVGKRTRLFEMDFVPDFPPSYIGYLTKEEDTKGWNSHDLEPGDTIYNVLCEKMKDKFEPLITTPDIIMENLKKLGHNNLYEQVCKPLLVF